MKLPDRKSIGYKIRIARVAAGMSQHELGLLTFIPQKQISLYEANKCLPTFPSLSKIAQVLDKPLVYFLEDYKAEF